MANLKLLLNTFVLIGCAVSFGRVIEQGLSLKVRPVPQESDRTFKGYNVACHYCPFSQLRLTPITESNIDKTYDISSLVAPSKDKLLALLESPTSSNSQGSKYDPHEVRLRLQTQSGRVIFVDRFGNVREGEKRFMLSAAGYRELREYLNEVIPEAHYKPKVATR